MRNRMDKNVVYGTFHCRSHYKNVNLCGAFKKAVFFWGQTYKPETVMKTMELVEFVFDEKNREIFLLIKFVL